MQHDQPIHHPSNNHDNLIVAPNEQSNNQPNNQLGNQLNSPSYVVDVRSSSAPSAIDPLNNQWSHSNIHSLANSTSNSPSYGSPRPWRNIVDQSDTDDYYGPPIVNIPQSSLFSTNRLFYCSIFFFLCFFIFFIEYIYVDRSLHVADTKRFEASQSALQNTRETIADLTLTLNQLSVNQTLKDALIDDLIVQLGDRDHALSLYRELIGELYSEKITENEKANQVLNQTNAIMQAISQAKKPSRRAHVETITRIDEVEQSTDQSDEQSANQAAAAVLVDSEGNNYILSKPSDLMKTVDNRLIVDLGIVIISSVIGGLIARLMRQPVLLGYLLGGSVIGPGGLGLIGQFVQVETLAEFGATFLLFALGVEFSFEKLSKVKNIAFGGGSLSLVLCIVCTAFLTWLGLDWRLSKGFFVGAILSMSSTTVVMKSLMERKQINTSVGQVMLGLLIVQDLFLSLILSILALVKVPREELFGAVLIHMFKFALLAVILVVASYVWPLVLKMLDHSRSHDLFLLGLVALCVMLTVTTERIIGSAEVGAFLSGILISSSPTAEPALIQRSLRLFEPIRDFFGAVFFSSMGMLIHPQSLLDHWFWIAMFVPATIAVKTCITFVVCRVFKQDWSNSIHVALCLSQIGEFSFILASQGLRAGLLERDDYMMLLGVTAVSIFVTPGLIAGAYAVRSKLTHSQATIPSKTRVLNDQTSEKVYEMVNVNEADNKRASAQSNEPSDSEDTPWDEEVAVPASNTPVQRAHVSSSSHDRTPTDRSTTQSTRTPTDRSQSQSSAANNSTKQSSSQPVNQPISLNAPTNWREARRQRQIARARRLAAEDAEVAQQQSAGESKDSDE